MSSEGTKTFTRAEVAKHNTNKDTWLLIHNNVYDVTAFLNEVRVCWRRRNAYTLELGARRTFPGRRRVLSPYNTTANELITIVSVLE